MKITPLPTLRQLQFFNALVRRNSFSGAAEECFVSQSTLSSAIKELEAQLQCQLVDRSSRNFGLTPAGEEVYQRAQRILADAEDMARAVEERDILEGPFHLGVIPTIAPFILPKAAGKIGRAYPDLELFLREDLTDNLVDRLHTGGIDAALLAFPYEISGVEVLEFGQDPFCFVASEDHPLAAKKRINVNDLANADLMLLEDGHCLRGHAIDACQLRAKNPTTDFGATSLFTLVQMVRAGLGVTLLPDMAVRAGFAKVANLVTVPMTKPVPSRKIGIAWRKGSGRADDAKALGAIFKQQFPEEFQL